jgi:hypothetical protein
MHDLHHVPEISIQTTYLSFCPNCSSLPRVTSCLKRPRPAAPHSPDGNIPQGPSTLSCGHSFQHIIVFHGIIGTHIQRMSDWHCQSRSRLQIAIKNLLSPLPSLATALEWGIIYPATVWSFTSDNYDFARTALIFMPDISKISQKLRMGKRFWYLKSFVSGHFSLHATFHCSLHVPLPYMLSGFYHACWE